MQECACDDPERLASLLGLDAAEAAVGDRVAAQAPVPGQVLARLDRARAAAPGEHLGEEDDRVEADQHVGGDRRAAADAQGGRGADRRPLPGALRAAHPDRGRGHALRTDRAPAVGARDAGLAARMPVAGLGHGAQPNSGRSRAQSRRTSSDRREASDSAVGPRLARDHHLGRIARGLGHGRGRGAVLVRDERRRGLHARGVGDPDLVDGSLAGAGSMPCMCSVASPSLDHERASGAGSGALGSRRSRPVCRRRPRRSGSPRRRPRPARPRRGRSRDEAGTR